MSVADKIGQLIQVNIASIELLDLRSYKHGSILNGGNLSLVADVRVDRPATAPVALGMVSTDGKTVTVPITRTLATAKVGD